MNAGRHSAALIALSLLLTPRLCEAQLRGGSAFEEAGAGSTLALSGEAGAIGDNPAALGLSDTPSWSVSILPVVAGRGTSPIGLDEVNRWSGRSIPFEERAIWMDGISEAGGVRGRANAQLTVAAVQLGNFGVQVTSRGTGRLSLSEGAAELLLFGNRGREGTTPDLDLDGSVVDAEIISTFGFGWGRAIYRSADSGPMTEVSVGATLTLIESHFLLIGQDKESVVGGDPPEVEVHFPVLESVSTSPGRGAGLTFGATWLRGPWTVSAVVHEAVQIFRWDESAFRYRPMTASVSDDQLDMDVGLRPVEEAPQRMRDALRSRKLPVRTRIGAAFEVTGTTTLSAEFARGLVGDAAGNPTHRVGVGVRVEPFTSGVGVQAGISGTGEGVRIGGGLRFHSGPVRLSGALLSGQGSGDDGFTFAFGVDLLSR